MFYYRPAPPRAAKKEPDDMAQKMMCSKIPTVTRILHHPLDGIESSFISRSAKGQENRKGHRDGGKTRQKKRKKDRADCRNFEEHRGNRTTLKDEFNSVAPFSSLDTPLPMPSHQREAAIPFMQTLEREKKKSGLEGDKRHENQLKKFKKGKEKNTAPVRPSRPPDSPWQPCS
jgi:hypothetical protein